MPLHINAFNVTIALTHASFLRSNCFLFHSFFFCISINKISVSKLFLKYPLNANLSKSRGTTEFIINASTFDLLQSQLLRYFKLKYCVNVTEKLTQSLTTTNFFEWSR